MLLKKETFHRQREGPSALTALDLAPLDSFVIDVIKWILRVFTSMVQSLTTNLTLTETAGRATIALSNSSVDEADDPFPRSS